MNILRNRSALVADDLERTASLEGQPRHNVLRERLRNLSGQDGLPMGWLVISFALASLLIISRCPSLFTHPQFYAEDGQDWFAQAYNLGWLHSLTLPYMGYLVTTQRLAGGVAMLVPFEVAPLMMALVGLFLQAGPVPLLLSSRFRQWAPLPTRLAFAAAYVAIPNAREIHVVCTNSQWHLALIMVLLALAEIPRSLTAKIFDLALIFLGALSGPFAILAVSQVLSTSSPDPYTNLSDG